MNAMKMTAEQRHEFNRLVRQANNEFDKKVKQARREAAEAGIAEAEKWLKTDGMRQMFKALMAVVYYTLHMRRPGKGFDSKRGIESFHKDLILMMNECLEDYDFKTDDDALFVCSFWLKQIGVNLDEMEMPISFELRWS